MGRFVRYHPVNSNKYFSKIHFNIIAFMQTAAEIKKYERSGTTVARNVLYILSSWMIIEYFL
jgi:hypothetical protein